MTAPSRYAPGGLLAGFPAVEAVPVARVNPVIRAALYLYVFSIPFEMPGRSIPLEIPTLTGFIFLATTLLQPETSFRLPPGAIRWFLLHLWILVWLGVFALLSDLDHLGPIVRHLVVLAQVSFLCWTAFNLLEDPRVLRGLLLTLAIACSLRALAQVGGFEASVSVDYYGDSRVTAFGQNPNLSAMILSAGLVTVVGAGLGQVPGVRRLGLIAWPVAAVIGFAVIQTGSRGGLLALAVGLAAFFLMSGRTPGKRIRNALLGLAALGALAWGTLQSGTMRHRFSVAGAEQSDLAGRERIYPTAVTMFVERPLLGWGPIENTHEIARRINRDRGTIDAHNLLLELVTSGGLLGALPFVAGLGLVVTAAWRARRGPLGALPLALVGAVLTGTVSGTWISAKILWLAFAVALAADRHWTPPPARVAGVGR